MRTSSPVRRLELELSERLGRRHCVATGRGATAIYLALRALGAHRGKVVLPSIVCPSPANATVYAGLEPIFCDVSLTDFNMDPGSLTRVLDRNADVVAIMPVHLYGQPAPMEEIIRIARSRNLPVIEDAAQALGGSYRGAKLGALGDISIVSFGHTKTLDVGWGGAALTDDPRIAAAMRAVLREIPPCPPNLADRFAEYRQVYYTLRPLAEANPQLHALFLPLPSLYRDLHLFTLPEDKADSIRAALSGLESCVNLRRAHAHAYRSRLQHPDLIHPRLDEQSAPWRYSFLTRADRHQRLLTDLRGAGIDVSDWYPPLHHWYASGRAQDAESFPNAELIGRQVVNLWVDPHTNLAAIQRTCDRLNDFLDSTP